MFQNARQDISALQGRFHCRLSQAFLWWWFEVQCAERSHQAEVLLLPWRFSLGGVCPRGILDHSKSWMGRHPVEGYSPPSAQQSSCGKRSLSSEDEIHHLHRCASSLHCGQATADLESCSCSCPKTYSSTDCTCGIPEQVASSGTFKQRNGFIIFLHDRQLNYKTIDKSPFSEPCFKSDPVGIPAWHCFFRCTGIEKQSGCAFPASRFFRPETGPRLFGPASGKQSVKSGVRSVKLQGLPCSQSAQDLSALCLMMLLFDSHVWFIFYVIPVVVWFCLVGFIGNAKGLGLTSGSASCPRKCSVDLCLEFLGSLLNLVEEFTWFCEPIGRDARDLPRLCGY